MVEKIKSLAKARGMTIMQLEEQCGIGQKSIYDWDTHRPKVDTVKRVADFFGVTINDLIESDNQQ